MRIPHHDSGFTCTSDAALHSLGGIQLTICAPYDVPDREIYDWFLDRGVRPVLITPTFVSGVLKSRDRIVYFNDTAWPSKNFLDNDKPRRRTASVTPGIRALFNIPIAS
ncbi:hypothetical protein PHMEG_00031398 [Phytophthora megakarya]|uniref:Uncharacterized protein n=1 Tax=Phytophthora megakarya TaxID=4795 RepID=A0A225UY46_9STRA|nr:hypothetical protein PHMEG_00031398 [Phytophthora megakarya]